MFKKLLWILICLSVIFGNVNIYAVEETTEEYVDETLYSITESFDVVSGMYVEKIDDDIQFLSSVPQGGVVSDGVYLEVPANVNVELTRDGDSVPFYNETPICNSGYYIMKLTARNSRGEERAGVFGFRIGAPPSGKVATSEYRYPKISCNAAITSDGNTGMYKYTLPNYKAFFTNVKQYGESVESARFVIPRNLGYSLKRNGVNIGLVNNKVYSQSGNYTLKVFGYSNGQENGYDACYETILNFTIPAPQTSSSTSSAVSSIVGSSGSTGTVTSSSASGSTGTAGIPASVPDLSYDEPEIDEQRELINDSLLENYFESANIYSETFSTGDAFFTNTPNDGIVGGNVYFDIPYNMSVSMTKDGVPVQFNNKTYINEEGSYILLVTDVYDGETYTARFSFRIQKGMDSSGAVDTGDTFTENTSEGAQGEDETRKENENSESDVDYDVVNHYDAERGMYVFDCGNEQFYMSVPDGMFSNYEVILDVPDTMEAVLYRNDEEIEYTDTISDDGRYTLNVTSDTGECEVSFDLAVYSVNYMEEFVAPEGYSFMVAEYSDYNGTYSNVTSEEGDEYEEGLMIIEDQRLNLSNVFELPIDGQYDFLLQGKRGMPILSATIILDTTAPVITFEGLEDNMRTENTSVEIICDDSEAEVVLIGDDDGEETVDMAGGRAIINGEGKYTLIAKDMAGNESEYDFVLGSEGSPFLAISIAVLVFVIAFIALIIILMRTGVIRGTFGKDSENKGSIFEKLPFKNKNKDNKSTYEDNMETDEYKDYNSTNDDWENSSFEDDWEKGGYDPDDGWEDNKNSEDDWENS